MIVEIKRIWPPFNDSPVGFIDLTNGIQIWFGVGRTITTEEQAVKLANKIIKSLKTYIND